MANFVYARFIEARPNGTRLRLIREDKKQVIRLEKDEFGYWATLKQLSSELNAELVAVYEYETKTYPSKREVLHTYVFKFTDKTIFSTEDDPELENEWQEIL